MIVKKQPRNKNKDYVDNKKMFDEVKIYIERLKLSEINGKPKPRQPDYLGKCFIDIANNFGNKHNFRNYPFLQEMVSDGIFACVKALDMYDISKENPLAFFTQVIFYAFLQRIDKEKKHLYTKFKSAIHSNTIREIADHQAHDDTFSIEELAMSSESTDVMNAFITAYDETLRKRRVRKTNDKDSIDN